MADKHDTFLHLESGLLLKGPFKGQYLNSVPLEYLKVLYETVALSNHERRTVGAVIEFKELRSKVKKKKKRRK